jgi:homoserine dehydrogenase
MENRALLEDRLGFSLNLKKIADVDTRRDRGVRIPPGMLTTDANGVIDDPDIQIVIELIGGIEPARAFILRSLERGRHVVTANKALLATHGRELFDAAQTHGRDLYYEAAVGGGIPIIKTQGGARREQLHLHLPHPERPCNNILTEMGEKVTTSGRRFPARSPRVPRERPTLDFEGIDAAPISLVTSLAYASPEWGRLRGGDPGSTA